MSTLTLVSPKEIMMQDLDSLRRYVTSIFVRQSGLTGIDEREKERLMGEFLAVGGALDLTERDLVMLLYRGIFHGGKSCGCHSCRNR